MIFPAERFTPHFVCLEDLSLCAMSRIALNDTRKNKHMHMGKKSINPDVRLSLGLFSKLVLIILQVDSARWKESVAPNKVIILSPSCSHEENRIETRGNWCESLYSFYHLS
mmetsp:Transcript_2047/g.3011  ORF Transcript_2047/g.3011 Transcript_2047/m.3011 type:complete len:111 (-) Transcript_2047:1383-1715(-)